MDCKLLSKRKCQELDSYSSALIAQCKMNVLKNMNKKCKYLIYSFNIQHQDLLKSFHTVSFKRKHDEEFDFEAPLLKRHCPDDELILQEKLKDFKIFRLRKRKGKKFRPVLEPIEEEDSQSSQQETIILSDSRSSSLSRSFDNASSSQETFARIPNLPSIIKAIILKHYLDGVCKQRNLNWPNSLARLNDFNILKRLFDSIDKFGYIKINLQQYENVEFVKYLLMDKFKKANFNFDFFQLTYLHKCMDHITAQILNRYDPQKRHDRSLYQEIKHQSIIAGGVFTNYVVNDEINDLFPNKSKHFIKAKDIDIFTSNQTVSQLIKDRPSSVLNETIEEDYSNTKEMFLIPVFSKQSNNPYHSDNHNGDLLQYVITNLISVKKINHTEDPFFNNELQGRVIDFDFDCCKIFFSFKENRLFIQSSLIFPGMEPKLPSFFKISSPNSDKLKQRCLKYMLKGFYDPRHIQTEYEQYVKLSPNLF